MLHESSSGPSKYHFLAGGQSEYQTFDAEIECDPDEIRVLFEEDEPNS